MRDQHLSEKLLEVVDAAIAIADADFGNVQLIDPASGHLKMVAQRGFPQWWLDSWESVTKASGICSAAPQRAERVIIDDVEKDSLFPDASLQEMQRKAGVRSMQCTPIISRAGQPLGMLSTHYRTPCQPDARALHLLDLLARHAADIIEHAQTVEDLRKSEERYRALVIATSAITWSRPE